MGELKAKVKAAAGDAGMAVVTAAVPHVAVAAAMAEVAEVAEVAGAAGLEQPSSCCRGCLFRRPVCSYRFCRAQPFTK